MSRAARRWKHAFAWILCLCLVTGCAMAAFTWLHEPDLYRAVYTLYAMPKADDAPLEASRMLARDCRALTRTDTFRENVLAKTRSDGQSRVDVQGIDGTHLLELSVVGPTPSVVQSLANAAGRALVQEASDTLGAKDVREITAAALPETPYAPNRPLKTLFAVLAAFGVGSVLSLLFGSEREPLRFENMAESSALPLLGGMADLRREMRRFEKGRKKRRVGMLLNHVDRLVREDIRAATLKLRATLGGKGGCVAITSVRANEQQAAFSALLAGELAAQGFRVLLVEMESQAPLLAELLAVDTRADLSDHLRGRAALRDIVVRPQDSTLCFIDQKHRGQSAVEIVSVPAFAAFLSSARANFDYVLLNAAPMEGCSDAAMLGACADLTVLTARSGVYTARELAHAANEMRGVVKRFGGVVMTAVERENLGI